MSNGNPTSNNPQAQAPLAAADAQLARQLGALFESGKFREMEAAARHLTARYPQRDSFWKALGTALAVQGRAAEALPAMQRAAALAPNDPDAQLSLGMILLDLRDYAAAEQCLAPLALAYPRNAPVHDALGSGQKALGKFDAAEVSFRRAIEINPAFANAHGNLGVLLHARSRLSEAEASFREVIRLQPKSAQALVSLGTALAAQARTAEATACFRRAIELEPNDPAARSTLLFMLGYDTTTTPAARLAEAQEYGRLVTVRVPAPYPFREWLCEPSAEKIRVGIISGDLHTHPVAYFIEALLEHFDPAKIELVGYPTSSTYDDLTARIRPRFADWTTLVGLGNEAAAKAIHADGIHVLLDLSGHTTANRLPVLAWKPAPIQVSWLGFCATTGMTQMDYVFADHDAPASLDAQFVETLWRLPDARVCFGKPQMAPPVTDLPALANGYVTFSCYQNLAKVSDGVLVCWQRILAQLPASKIRVQCRELGLPEVREQFTARLIAHGIDPARVALQKSVPREQYLAAFSDADIALDTFPYPGTTTTCEALWMGVPTVTLAGNSLLGREGVGVMKAVGLPDYIAVNEDEYVAKAVKIASDIPALSALRVMLRERVAESPVFDSAKFARNLESAFREMWEKFSRARSIA